MYIALYKLYTKLLFRANIYLNSSHLALFPMMMIYHTAMATHPTGETVDIVGINCGDNG